MKNKILIVLMMLPMLAFADTSDYVWNEQFAKKLLEAEAGNARSQYNIGNMYLKGQGTAIDESKAFEWIKKSASSGYVKAEFKVGFMSLKGLGTKKSYRNAEKWLRKAANKDYAPAQYYLAGMYRDGQYLAKNYDKALFWLKKAQANGFWKAANEYDKVIALAQRGGAKATSQPVVKSKPKPKPKPKIKQKPKPKPKQVASAKQTETVAESDDLRDLLMKGQWLERGKPARYLPSSLTRCKKKNKGLYCASQQDLNSQRGNTKFTYRIIVSIKNINESGEFSVDYRNNVLSVIPGKPVIIPGDEESPPSTRPSPVVNTGLQRTVHNLECTLDNARQISCIKDHSREFKLTRR